jgi:hypothetical protein
MWKTRKVLRFISLITDRDGHKMEIDVIKGQFGANRLTLMWKLWGKFDDLR